jgi:hypothetical protein
MNTFAKLAGAMAVTGLMAVPMATPSQAAWHGGHHWGGRGAAAAIGFGAGALVGAAAANAAYGPDYYYGSGPDYGYGYDDYAYAGPGYDAYAYSPGYRHGWVSSSTAREYQCTLSPGSQAYVPCDNNR